MRFGDVMERRDEWITLVESPFYPDTLEAAAVKYGPVIQRFGELLAASRDSSDLFLRIVQEARGIRTQLQRIFRKYVSPDTPVEMLKKKEDAQQIVANFGDRFRPLPDVRQAFRDRPAKDEALIALLAEYETRGQKGYKLTAAFFEWFQAKFKDRFVLEGPSGAGPDVPLRRPFPDYPTENTVDFVIRDRAGTPVVVGYARYDSDRGGAQGLDRITSYGDKVSEILGYADRRGIRLGILLINDGPGLLLGLLWSRYAALEEKWGDRVLVATLKMLDARVTADWIEERRERRRARA